MGIGPGDEVICPAFTFYATAEAIARARRYAGLRRHRPGDAQPRSRGRRAAGSRRGRRRSCRCTSSAAPPPLAELAELGLPLIEDAAQAFGAAGIADHRRRLDVQLLPDEEPLRRSATAASARSPMSSSRERVRMLRFHGSKRQEDVRVHRLQLAPRRAAGGRAAALPRRSSTSGTPPRREAAARYAELGLGEFCELPADEPGHVYHMYVVRTPERDRLRRRRSARPEIASASYYIVPLHLQPALRFLGYEEGSLPETERAAGENLALPLWAGHRRRRAGARRRGHPRRPRVVSGARDPGQPAPDLAAARPTRCSSRPPGTSPSSCASTPRCRRSTSGSSTRRCLRRRRPQAGSSSSPSASTTAGGATSRRGTCGALARGVTVASLVVLPADLLLEPRPGLPRARRRRRRRLAAPARARRRLAAPGAHARRAPGRRRSRRARQGGRRRRRRRRRASSSSARCSRNRSLGYTPIGLVDDDPRKKNLRIHGVRVLGTTEELPRLLREHRPDEVLIAMPVRVRRGAAADRRRRARRGRAGQDAARRCTSSSQAITWPGRSGRSRSRTCSAASRSRSTSTRSPPTWPARPCSSPARAARSAPSSAARSRASAPQRLVLVDQAETPMFEIERELVGERGFSAAIPVLADVGNRDEDAPGLRALPAGGRLPRRRLQARAADGGEPDRVRAQQRARDEGRWPTSPSSSARAASCSSRPTRRSTRAPSTGSARRSASGSSRRTGHRDDMATRFVARALRQRARLGRQRHPDLPPPDRRAAAR